MTSPVHGLAAPANVLIAGASSGIGLAMVRALLTNDAIAHVVAVARGAEAGDELKTLRDQHGKRLLLVSADITSDAGLATLVQRVQREMDSLHLVINCAGMLHGQGVRPEKALTAVRRDTLAQVFSLNAFAPLLLVQALMPLMKHRLPMVLASLSARVGSITDNQLGGWYAYRASKAAQNQLFRTLSVELRRTHPAATCVLLHPGTVDTPLSKPFQTNVPADKLFSPKRAAQQLLDVIAALTPADTGRFIAWDGSSIPW